MKLHVLLAIGLAFGLIVSTFAQQKEPSPSEQDHAQIVAGGGGTTRGSSALKPISQSALQSMLDATARELLIPGAVVLVRTPQGEFTATYGTTQLGTKIPPTTDTYFRIASNTKTMTAAVIVQLAQEGKLRRIWILSPPRSFGLACRR
jgi:D-alanyl-D-alanine carboxypeptidase